MVLKKGDVLVSLGIEDKVFEDHSKHYKKMCSASAANSSDWLVCIFLLLLIFFILYLIKHNTNDKILYILTGYVIYVRILSLESSANSKLRLWYKIGTILTLEWYFMVLSLEFGLILSLQFL